LLMPKRLEELFLRFLDKVFDIFLISTSNII
jgi:hypothetical protein